MGRRPISLKVFATQICISDNWKLFKIAFRNKLYLYVIIFIYTFIITTGGSNEDILNLSSILHFWSRQREQGATYPSWMWWMTITFFIKGPSWLLMWPLAYHYFPTGCTFISFALSFVSSSASYHIGTTSPLSVINIRTWDGTISILLCDTCAH